MVIVLTYIDIITNAKIALTLFYVLLVIYTTWSVNLKYSIFVTFLVTASTAYVDIMLFDIRPDDIFNIINLFTRLIVLIIVCLLTEKIIQRNIIQEKIIKERTEKLEKEITERITKENLLSESELKYKNLLNNEPVAVLRWNLLDNRVDYANKEFTRQSGYTMEEYDKLSDEQSISMIYPDDREMLFGFYRDWAAADYKDNQSITYRIINREGKIIWLDTFLYAERSKEGTAKFINQVCYDITDKKLTEESLIKSKQRYQSFIENSNEGIYRIEFDVPIDLNKSDDEVIKSIYRFGYVAECNNEFGKMYGYENASSVIGDEIARIFGYNPRQNNSIDSIFKNFISNGFKTNDFVTEEIVEGNKKYFRKNLVGIITDNKLVRIWGIQQEITELRSVQEKNHAFSRAIEQSPDAIVIMDTDFKIQYTNPKFEEITEFNELEIQNKRPFIILKENTPDEKRKEILRALLSGKVWKGEYPNQTKSGKKYWEFATIAPIKNEQGEITNYVYIKKDISDRKKSEAELIEAKIKAEEANKIKDEFIANMSHEIRTPMNGIIGMIQLLEMGNLDEEQTDCIETIKYSSDLLLKIINDILDFSKLEFGNVKLNYERFNMKEVGKNIYNIFANEAKSRGLDFRITLNSEFNYLIAGDLHRVNQILINLISNSLKFTSNGFIELAIYENHKNNHKVIMDLKVKDSGIGIPKEKFGMLFESFTQLENPYTKRHMGTGLGLAIVKKIVDLMNGVICVDSEPGKGSEFAVQLTFDLVRN
jgi:PAS domain S-box-containing protein